MNTFEYKNINPFKYYERLQNERQKYKRVCSCGCVSVMPKASKNTKGYIVCRWCGKKLFINDTEQKKHDEQVKRENFRMKMWSLI